MVSKEMPNKDYKTILGFSDAWLSLGILTDDELQQFGKEFDTGNDPHTEHYRYRAFVGYMMTRRPINEETALALYELGTTDPDRLMGFAIMICILNLPECPEAIFETALKSDDGYLIELVNKRRTYLSPSRSEHKYGEIISPCLNDPYSQRELLKRPDLTVEQLEVLATEGANRGVRNWASRRWRLTKRHNDKPPSKAEGLS